MKTSAIDPKENLSLLKDEVARAIAWLQAIEERVKSMTYEYESLQANLPRVLWMRDIRPGTFGYPATRYLTVYRPNMGGWGFEIEWGRGTAYGFENREKAHQAALAYAEAWCVRNGEYVKGCDEAK